MPFAINIYDNGHPTAFLVHIQLFLEHAFVYVSAPLASSTYDYVNRSECFVIIELCLERAFVFLFDSPMLPLWFVSVGWRCMWEIVHWTCRWLRRHPMVNVNNLPI